MSWKVEMEMVTEIQYCTKFYGKPEKWAASCILSISFYLR